MKSHPVAVDAGEAVFVYADPAAPLLAISITGGRRTAPFKGQLRTAGISQPKRACYSIRGGDAAAHAPDVCKT